MVTVTLSDSKEWIGFSVEKEETALFIARHTTKDVTGGIFDENNIVLYRITENYVYSYGIDGTLEAEPYLTKSTN